MAFCIECGQKLVEGAILIDELYEVTEDEEIEETCKKIMDILYYLYEEKVER